MKQFLDKYFPFAAWTLLLVLATWGAWWIVTGREHIPPTPVGTNPSNLNNGQIPPVVMDQPMLQEVTPDGNVVWTLYLQRIDRESGSVTALNKPRAEYKLKSGEVLEITGDSGTYDEDSGVLKIEGNVTGKARNASLSFWVGNLTWNSKSNELTATGNIQMDREGIRFTGTDLKMNLANELAHIEVTGGVEITGAPGSVEQLGGGSV